MKRSQVRFSIVVIVAVLCLLAWSGFLRKPGHLERVKDTGQLTVVTRIGPDTYHRTNDGPTGLEYDLAQRFARQLGVSLKIKVASSIDDALNMLMTGKADLAAAGIGITAERERRYRLTDPYMSVHPQLVYRTGQSAPKELDALAKQSVPVAVNPGQLAYLRQTKDDGLDGIQWQQDDSGAEDILYRVWNGDLRYAVVDSNEVLLSRHFYPELRVAFDVGGVKPLAWAFSPDTDGSIYRRAQSFFARMEKNGTLARLQERYYGHLDQFDYVGTRVFMRHVAGRLPKYRADFKKAAKEAGLDWRLLAAIGYQESHWNPGAVSPTGVRGVMMLTRDTAAHMGIDNRVDASQSILGGALYFARVKEKIPERIPEPIRTWFALAAYNVGFGHLEDARIITESQGADPDAWVDVKKRLPLLSQKKWYSRTEHGYARGWEPVRYVENVRRYYELLIRITEPGLMTVDGADGSQAPPADPAPTRGMHLGDAVESAF